MFILIDLQMEAKDEAPDTEMGTGNDLYGEDYTKAANRAVQDALHTALLFCSGP